ncbi:MAG: hypothetical protein E7081_02710 [Bacteroidales bacterium]|nr:hypothetical protein [Bacteroidales bacterium]
MKQKKQNITIVVVMMLVVVMVSCSTTRRLSIEDPLYTGVKRVRIEAMEREKLPTSVKDAVKEAVNVTPNNSLISPTIRHPFPIGLWVYNNWNNPPSGIKHWLYEKLVEEPVLLSDVRPELRVKMIDEILENNGYFSADVNYELIRGKNPKKVRIAYDVNTGPIYRIDSIELLPDTTHLYHIIDSVAKKSSLLTRGMRYCTDSLSELRIEIANQVRNRGYYFFRPEYIEYLADSTISQRNIALRMAVANDAPTDAFKRYVTGDIMVYVHRNEGGGIPDTIETSRGRIIQMTPSRLRNQLIPECVAFREGKVFSVRDMNRTQTYLSRLGIFKDISIDVVPDTIKDNRLNVVISCTQDAPLELSMEVNATSKSNSYLGPGLAVGVTNKNLFGGGEQLNVSLTGSYEWQTGRNRNSLFNSYEFGIKTSLSFPRLLAPRFIPRRRRVLNWTRLSLDAEILNRPHYFKMAQFNAAMTYDWQATRYASNSLTIGKITYTKLLNTTVEFDSIMSENLAVAQSFQNQFVPQIAYSYTYDRRLNKNNSINWQFTVQEAGNICWALWELAGGDGEKRMFNTPFSQFIKGYTQLVYNHRLVGEHWLVSRLATGVAHAYGNSTQVPYSEQFYVGGANSVRAFTVRSIGPGSYRVPNATANDYFDQTGTFKFEMNMEYRFPIYGMFKGAMFVDAGNVWLLKGDSQRPGGTLRSSSFFRDLALGTGVGLRLDIGMLVVRGDLGIGIHAPYDTGKSGYYNMTSFKDSLAFHLAIGYPF